MSQTFKVDSGADNSIFNFSAILKVFILLYKWLASIRLEQLYQKLHDAGYEDPEVIAQQMNSNHPVDNELLKASELPR